MMQEEFLRTFGAPKASQGDLWKYDWTLKAKYTKEEKQNATRARYQLSDK
jgi:hypothetical protein